MNKILIAILLFAFIASCQPEKEASDVKILKEDEMIEIIKDIQLLEAAHKDLGIFGVERKALADTSYMIVFNKHGVKASEFDSSYNYYLRNPIKFEKLMTEVERSINLNP